MDRAANQLNAPHGSSMAGSGPLTAAAPHPPSQAEYASIREALMSTARGRWFLDEYARANRHADTRTVLDAVERLERAVAAQVLDGTQGVPAALEASQAVSKGLLRERLGVLMTALAAREDAVAPHERATQKFQAVIWTLREGGADLRLCDLLATQADAISEAHRALGTADAAIIAVMESLCCELGLVDDTRPPQDFAQELMQEPAEDAAQGPSPAAVTAALPTEPAAALKDIVASKPIADEATPEAAVPQQAVGASLGDAVLASGLIRSGPTDPLAMLARLSQAEKIALFT